ncbi:hypothetical protein [Bradyrhizobium sp. ISRA442]|uniref:hypothetical protein n=1 Tax=Bradyrhizobium sp. ISRA442 TaxID=2866197 RepID=UPI00311AF6B6
MIAASTSICVVTSSAVVGESDRRFTCARLADQIQHLAAAQRQVDALDNLAPAIVALPFDPEAPDLKKCLARRRSAIAADDACAGAHSRSPLVK